MVHTWLYARLADGTRSDTWCKWCGMSRESHERRGPDCIDDSTCTRRRANGEVYNKGRATCRRTCKPIPSRCWGPYGVAFRCGNKRAADSDFCWRHRVVSMEFTVATERGELVGWWRPLEPTLHKDRDRCPHCIDWGCGFRRTGVCLRYRPDKYPDLPHEWYSELLLDGTPSDEWCVWCQVGKDELDDIEEHCCKASHGYAKKARQAPEHVRKRLCRYTTDGASGWHTPRGMRCRNRVREGTDFCRQHHQPKPPTEIERLRELVPELARQVGWHQLRAELAEEQVTPTMRDGDPE